MATEQRKWRLLSRNFAIRGHERWNHLPWVTPAFLVRFSKTRSLILPRHTGLVFPTMFLGFQWAKNDNSCSLRRSSTNGFCVTSPRRTSCTDTDQKRNKNNPNWMVKHAHLLAKVIFDNVGLRTDRTDGWVFCLLLGAWHENTSGYKVDVSAEPCTAQPRLKVQVTVSLHNWKGTSEKIQLVTWIRTNPADSFQSNIKDLPDSKTPPRRLSLFLAMFQADALHLKTRQPCFKPQCMWEILHMPLHCNCTTKSFEPCTIDHLHNYDGSPHFEYLPRRNSETRFVEVRCSNSSLGSRFRKQSFLDPFNNFFYYLSKQNIWHNFNSGEAKIGKWPFIEFVLRWFIFGPFQISTQTSFWLQCATSRHL